MQLPFNTVSLIGMPGAGKSTIGILLAKLCGLRFTDSDLDIQLREGATLQEILEARGHKHLRSIEEEVLLTLPLSDAVVATGGSVVYSTAAMSRLQGAGPVVHLDVDLGTLERRVATAPERGIASDPGQSFADIYRERTPLYQQYADYTVSAAANNADTVARMIFEQLRKAE